MVIECALGWLRMGCLCIPAWLVEDSLFVHSCGVGGRKTVCAFLYQKFIAYMVGVMYKVSAMASVPMV